MTESLLLSTAVEDSGSRRFEPNIHLTFSAVDLVPTSVHDFLFSGFCTSLQLSVLIIVFMATWTCKILTGILEFKLFMRTGRFHCHRSHVQFFNFSDFFSNFDPPWWKKHNIKSETWRSLHYCYTTLQSFVFQLSKPKSKKPLPSSASYSRGLYMKNYDGYPWIQWHRYFTVATKFQFFWFFSQLWSPLIKIKTSKFILDDFHIDVKHSPANVC